MTPNLRIELTDHQKGVWMESKMHPGKPLFNMGSSLRLAGVPDPKILEQAFRNVIAENDGLRIKIHEEKYTCFQEFEAEKDFKLNIKNFQEHENSEELALEWMHKDFLQTIELTASSLYEITLILCGDALSFIHFKSQHIYADGLTNALFVKKTAAHYNAILAGISHSDPSSFSQYVQKTLAGYSQDEKDKSLEFWKDKFKGFTRKLLFDKKDVNASNLPSSRKQFKYTREQFNDIGWAENKSIRAKFGFLLAALYATLTRSTGQKEIIIGLPLLNRFGKEEKNTIGYFVSMIPLRLSFDRNLSFRELVSGVLAEMKSSLYFRNVAIQDINKVLGVHSSNATQLYDVIFSYQAHKFDSNFGEASIASTLTFPMNYAQTALTIQIRDLLSTDDVEFVFDHNLNYLDDAEMQTLIRRFQKTVTYFGADINLSLDSMPFLSEDENLQLLKYAQGPETTLEKETVISKIEKRCASHPDKIILRDEFHTMTCGELISASQKLAAYLLESNTQLGDVIGVDSTRSARYFVSILGILMAGGCFVPIAPELPAERKKYLIQKAGAKSIIYSSNAARIQDLPECNWINLNTIPDTCTYIRPEIPFDNPIYIIFTSGTTGNPKGVQVANNNLLNLFDSMWTEVYSLYDANINLALLSSFNFDVFFMNSFSALMFGLELSIIPEEARKDDKLLVQFLVDHRIDICDGTPALFNSMLNRIEKAPKNLQLKHFFAGGEKFKIDLANKIFDWIGDEEFRITNVYGPTECTVYVSCYSFAKSEGKVTEEIPIGTPINNVNIWILDEAGQHAPPGVVGEICVCGSCVSLGYVNDPDLTDKVFKSTNYLSDRAYYTGDLGHWSDDGQLMFNGRKDTQVKLRGYRIELSEIEYWLGKLQHVSNAKVLLVKKGHQDILVGFIASKFDWTSSDVKNELSKDLPDYLIPHFIVRLDEFPLTNTGKIDGEKLKKHALNVEGSATHLPETATELLVAQRMGEVLDIKSVDVLDSFFSQGGDSLSLVLLLATLEEEFNKPISMSQFAAMNSVRRIAAFLDSETEATRKVLKYREEDYDLNVLDGMQNSIPTDSISRAFITGGTGFIGAFLIQEVVANFDAVLCHVRAATVEEGEARLRNTFQKFGLKGLDWDKIEIIPGDLAEENLGMSATDFAKLAEVNAIYHNGATVNFVKDFDTLKKANVAATYTLLLQCKTGRPKKFNYISTNSVFSDKSKTHSEGDSVENEVQYSDKGYASTKWVSDLMTQKSRDHGVDANIFRLGRITGESKQGMARYEDFFHRFIEGCIQINCFPEEVMENYTDLTPVDVTVQAIMELSKEKDTANYHLANNKVTQYKNLVEACKSQGVALKIAPYQDWLQQVDKLNKEDQKNPFFLITPILKQKAWIDPNITVLNNEFTVSKMGNVGIKWPESDQLGQTYIQNCMHRVLSKLNTK